MLIPNYQAIDIKYTFNSDQALKTRTEMGLTNLTCGSSDEPLETFNKENYGVVLDKQRRKAYILLRVNAQEQDDLYNFTSDVPEMYASFGLDALL